MLEGFHHDATFVSLLDNSLHDERGIGTAPAGEHQPQAPDSRSFPKEDDSPLIGETAVTKNSVSGILSDHPSLSPGGNDFILDLGMDTPAGVQCDNFSTPSASQLLDFCNVTCDKVVNSPI